jgi:hypothetical protein
VSGLLRAVFDVKSLAHPRNGGISSTYLQNVTMINTDRKYEKKNTEKDSISQDVTQCSIVTSSLGFH